MSKAKTSTKKPAKSTTKDIMWTDKMYDLCAERRHGVSATREKLILELDNCDAVDISIAEYANIIYQVSRSNKCADLLKDNTIRRAYDNLLEIIFDSGHAGSLRYTSPDTEDSIALTDSIQLLLEDDGFHVERFDSPGVAGTIVVSWDNKC